MHSLRALVLSLPLVLLSGSRAADEARPDAVERLKAMNAQARAVYAQGRERLLGQTGPIVLWDSEDLVFRWAGYRRVTRPTPALYHDLKTTGHVVLGLYALIAPIGDAGLKDSQRFQVREYRQGVRQTLLAIRQRGLSKEQLGRQEAILTACDDYLQGVLAADKVESKGLSALIRKVRPGLDENNTDAARGLIDALHREMLAYRGKLAPEVWKQLTVIVMGTQQPRKDNLAVQYFARLLGESGEGQRLIYAEGIFDENKALQLLGTKLLDRQVGVAFFDDPLRMERDLLGDAAKVQVDALFGK